MQACWSAPAATCASESSRPLLCPACRHAKSVSYFREGLEAFQKAYPFLVTSSQRASAATTRR